MNEDRPIMSATVL